ncbi:MAG: MmgE/PrpD family protein [Haloarculaceae archaeon]
MSETRTRATIDEDLAAFVAALGYDDLPEAAVRAAERVFVDTVGVTVAGAAEGAGEKAVALTTALSDGGDATLIGSDATATVTDAAFANATAGHGLDFDDVTWGVWHPSVPLVAPILALAEREGASGRAAIAAYVAGYETQVHLAEALLPAHYERGWHATATFGTFGAAAAAAVLLDLDREQTRHALNVAASMPAGLKRNFGTMTKPMHAGQAARSGVTAGLLAADGFTAAANAVGGERGFCDLYAGDAEPDLDDLPELGERWALLADGIQVKKYPCCYFTHPAVAGTRALVDEHGIAPGDVERVTVTASQGAADALHYPDPDTGLEGKFSMEYVVASAVARDRVGLAAFDDENVGDPAVQRVRERVDFQVDPDLEYNPYRTTVRIETADGAVERIQEKPPGTPEDPLSAAELESKFRMCVDRATWPVDADAAHRALDGLRDQDAAASALQDL